METTQLADRARDRRLLVTDIELHDLVAGPLTDVDDVDLDGQLAVERRHDRPVQAHVR